MKNQILDLLQWSTKDYEDYFFRCYWNWCIQHGEYPSIIQQYLANPSINRWFMREFSKKETDFIKIADVLGNKRAEKLEVHFRACTQEVIAIYPQGLMDEIKRNRSFSNIIITNTPVYYSN